MILMIAAHLW